MCTVAAADWTCVRMSSRNRLARTRTMLRLTRWLSDLSGGLSKSSLIVGRFGSMLDMSDPTVVCRFRVTRAVATHNCRLAGNPAELLAESRVDRSLLHGFQG